MGLLPRRWAVVRLAGAPLTTRAVEQWTSAPSHRETAWFLPDLPLRTNLRCPSGTAAAPPCLTFKMSAWLMKKTCSHSSKYDSGWGGQDEDDDDFAEDGGFF